MRKLIAIILVIVMSLAMTGCSGEELGMYSLVKEVMLMDVVETTGTASVTMKGQFVDGITEKAPKELDSIKKIFDPGMELRYTMKQDKKTSEYEAAVDFRFKGENQYKKLTTIIGNKKVIYVKLDDFFEFLKPYIVASEPASEKAVNEIISRIEYLEVDLEKDTYKGMYKKGYSGTAQDEKTIKVLTGFMDIFKEAFKGFSSGMVAKKANGYELTIEAKELGKLIISFMEYFAKNIDTIVNVTAEKVKAMSSEEFKNFTEVLGSTSLTREKMLADLEEMREKVKKTFPGKIEEMKENMTLDMVSASLGDSNYKYYLGKADNGSYEGVSTLKIRIENMLSVDYLEEAKTKKIEAFTIKKPENSVTQEEYEAIIESIIPPAVTEMRININNGSTKLKYSNDKSTTTKVDIIQRDGYTYLPINTLKDTFNENIRWDTGMKAAVADKKGEKVILEGYAGGGKTYVKAKELSKLGYFIYWDKWAKETVIQSPRTSSIFN